MPVKMEVFSGSPPCPGCIEIVRLCEAVAVEYAGETPRIGELKVSALPAVVIGDLVRIMGLCPSKESLVSALRECGLS